jgi:energy-coupling factor transporter ATP-binding protein EcfA2
MRTSEIAGDAAGLRVLGDTEIGPRRAVALRVEDGRFHTHVIGATESGKSTLVANLALADMAAGRGVVVIDPKGDLVMDLLARTSGRATERLVLVDPEETEAPPSLNVLGGEPAEVAVEHVVSVFARSFAAYWGPRTDDVLRSACATLRRLHGATLADVPVLLTDRRFRAPLVAGLSERSGLKAFWDGYDALSPAGQAQVIGPVMNKLRAVLARSFAQDLLGSATSSFSMADVLESGVLLARLPKGLLGEDTARLVGALLVARVSQAPDRPCRAGGPARRVALRRRGTQLLGPPRRARRRAGRGPWLPPVAHLGPPAPRPTAPRPRRGRLGERPQQGELQGLARRRPGARPPHRAPRQRVRPQPPRRLPGRLPPGGRRPGPARVDPSDPANGPCCPRPGRPRT